MVTVLITSFLLFAAISYVFYCWQRASSKKDATARGLMPPPPRFRGLFDDDAADASQATLVETSGITSQQRATLRERAAQGDKSALLDAHASADAALYDELLDALVEQADSGKKVLALVSYITRHEPLSVNRRLAEAFIESWKTAAAPDRSTTAMMLHVAALADDAALYRHAVETALQFWRDRRIKNLSAEELRTLAESEYWLLSVGVRSSGAGFVLKRKLAGLRRELAAAMTPIQ
ncbi:MAG: hypothetical protein WCF57_05610 [Pyrinomonadaceae bacterium]